MSSRHMPEQHTPGPWRVTKEGIIGNDVSIKDMETIASFFTAPDFADANLIAAAPELYEGLKRAREELRLIHMKDTSAIYDIGLRVMMDLVIAKAEGK